MFPKTLGFPPKSSILIGCSIINHPFWGTPIFGNTHIHSFSVLQMFIYSAFSVNSAVDPKKSTLFRKFVHGCFFVKDDIHYHLSHQFCEVYKD